MPLFIVSRKPDKVPDDLFDAFRAAFPAIAAAALDVPGNEEARVTPGDIVIWERVSGRFDVNTRDLEIIPVTHRYA